MDSEEFVKLLALEADDADIEACFNALNTLTRPSLDEDEPEQHFDWVLVRRKGVELGFVDAAYFAGKIKALWRSDGLILNQITYYSDTRESVNAYAGELPFGLTLSDNRESVCAKLAQHESVRRSYITDRWDIEHYRLIISYKPNDSEHVGKIDAVHIKMPLLPRSGVGRLQPKLTPQDWIDLFGLPSQSAALTQALTPLNLFQRIEDGEDAREVDFLDECGVTLYFEDITKLRTASTAKDRAKQGLAFGAVKFYRARDLEARAYTGTLPFAIEFDDDPDLLFKKVGRVPNIKNDGPMTGHALWHFDGFSLHVLYSTIDNQIFRAILMAPGYWTDAADIET